MPRTSSYHPLLALVNRFQKIIDFNLMNQGVGENDEEFGADDLLIVDFNNPRYHASQVMLGSSMQINVIWNDERYRIMFARQNKVSPASAQARNEAARAAAARWEGEHPFMPKSPSEEGE